MVLQVSAGTIDAAPRGAPCLCVPGRLRAARGWLRAAAFGAGGLVIVTLGAGPAHAYVQTFAAVTAGEADVGMIYAYNNPSTGNSSSDFCTGRGDCSATGLGTVDATGAATSSSDQVNLAVTLGPNRFNATDPVSGAASARASLASGGLGVLGTGKFSDNLLDGGQSGAYARGVATIYDGLHFTVVGANSATVTEIGVTFIVHGAISTDAQFGSSEYFTSSLSFGNASFHSTVQANLSGDRPPAYTFSDGQSNWASFGYTENSAEEIIFNGLYEFTGETADIGISATLDASCGDGFNCDFSHTGAISFTLPSDVTFTSDSGVFLTDAPEPGSLVLLSTGLGLAALPRRRRRGPD